MKLESIVALAILQSRRKVNFTDPNFPEQNLFVQDRSRFVAAQCSRRAGKSNGLALKFFKALEDHPGCFCPYIALTRESAFNIMWPVLQEQADIFKVNFKFTESNLTMTHPNGARLQLFGADMKNFIRRLKGIKTPGAAIDEAQDFGPHLESLVDDVLSPALTDYEDSWLAITGTPGPIPHGFFYEITHKKMHGFSLHKWTLFDNPYLPGARQFVTELKAKRGWDDDHPTLLREWQNNWVLDVESLLIKYNADKNDYEGLPIFKWNYILGVDIGVRDSDAIAVLAYSDSFPNIYLVEELITSDQDITTLANQLDEMIKKYNPEKIVMDEGALGKKLGEEFRRRKHIPVQPADKQRKFESIAFLNDYLRSGRFKARRTSRFAEDSFRVQIDWEKTTPDRIAVKSGFHSDIIDAVLYAYKESPAYTFQASPIKPKYLSPEWADAEVTRMEEAAEEHFKALEEAEHGNLIDI